MIEYLEHIIEGGLFLSIIGVYAWSYKIMQDVNKKLAAVYKTINSHINKVAIHTDKKEFMDREVCNVLHKNIDEKLHDISKDVKSLLAKIKP